MEQLTIGQRYEFFFSDGTKQKGTYGGVTRVGSDNTEAVKINGRSTLYMPTSAIVDVKEVKASAPKKASATQAKVCVRCGGTGKYLHYGECYGCGGTGRR